MYVPKTEKFRVVPATPLPCLISRAGGAIHGFWGGGGGGVGGGRRFSKIGILLFFLIFHGLCSKVGLVDTRNADAARRILTQRGRLSRGSLVWLSRSI
jgi:hypothetical protein